MYRVTHGNLASGQIDLTQISTLQCSITKQLATSIANTTGTCPQITMPIVPIVSYETQTRETELNQYNYDLAIQKRRRDGILRGNPLLCTPATNRFIQYERRPNPPVNCYVPPITSGLPKASPATCVNVVGIVVNNPPH